MRNVRGRRRMRSKRKKLKRRIKDKWEIISTVRSRGGQTKLHGEKDTE